MHADIVNTSTDDVTRHVLRLHYSPSVDGEARVARDISEACGRVNVAAAVNFIASRVRRMELLPKVADALEDLAILLRKCGGRWDVAREEGIGEPDKDSLISFTFSCAGGGKL